MELRHGRTVLVLDERRGEIIGLRDARSGTVHLDARGQGRDDGRLFRIMAPEPRWTSRYMDSHESAPPRILRAGDSAELTWTELVAPGNDARAFVTVRIEPAGADEFRFFLSVTNRGGSPLTDIWFPRLGGWTGLGGKGKDRMILGAFSSVDPHAFPRNSGMTCNRAHQRLQVTYPVGMYAPWVDLSGPGGGLSYVIYLAGPQNGYVGIENMAGHGPGMRLSFGWATPTVIEPGERWTAPPVGIALHAGDWHATADRFTQWADSWYVAPPSKPALREMIGYQNVFLRGFDGTPFRPLDAVPSIASAGRRFGVDHLSIWDYMTLGNYTKCADVDVLDYTPQEKQRLQQGLRQARAEGSNVNALINFRLCPPTSTLWHSSGQHEVVRCLDGSPRMECITGSHNHPAQFTKWIGPYCYVLSPFASSYRERILRQTRELMDLGYVSMFYDQPFEVLPDFGRRNEGRRPEETYGALYSLIGEVRRALHDNDPDGYVIGEFCEIYMSQHIDLCMAWYKDLQQAVRAAYSVPQTMHSWVVDNDLAQASHAFALGMYLCLCTHGNEGTLADVPAFGDHVHALARLRSKCARQTVHARFVDNRGLTVAGDDATVAYSFDGPAGPCVIVAAAGKGGAAGVQIDPQAFRYPGTPSVIHHLDGTSQATDGERCRFTLPPNGVAVWCGNGPR